jgi:hypothetical protein
MKNKPMPFLHQGMNHSKAIEEATLLPVVSPVKISSIDGTLPASSTTPEYRGVTPKSE